MTSTLSSDTLEQQFGPTELKVLYQSNNARIICTKTVPGGKILELSFVNFIETGITKFQVVHEEILGGKSIGKAFHDHGIEFRRETKAIHRDIFPPISASQPADGEHSTVVSVLILVGADKTPYAEILETYSPAVRWP